MGLPHTPTHTHTHTHTHIQARLSPGEALFILSLCTAQYTVNCKLKSYYLFRSNKSRAMNKKKKHSHHPPRTTTNFTAALLHPHRQRASPIRRLCAAATLSSAPSSCPSKVDT